MTGFIILGDLMAPAMYRFSDIPKKDRRTSIVCSIVAGYLWNFNIDYAMYMTLSYVSVCITVAYIESRKIRF